MKKLTAHHSGAEFGSVSINGTEVVFAKHKDNTYFSMSSLAMLQSRLTGKTHGRTYSNIYAASKREKSLRRFRDGPVIVRGRATTCFVTTKFIFESLPVLAGFYVDMMNKAGAVIKYTAPVPVPVIEPPMTEVITAAEGDKELTPAIISTEGGIDTIVFKGKNILQRLFGGLIRG